MTTENRHPYDNLTHTYVATVLTTLADGPMSARELAKRTGLDESFMSRVRKRLASEGLVEPKGATFDPMALTDKGLAIADWLRTYPGLDGGLFA